MDFYPDCRDCHSILKKKSHGKAFHCHLAVFGDINPVCPKSDTCVHKKIFIIIMKYLYSVNFWYTPELGALYKKDNNKTVKQKAFRLGQYEFVCLFVFVFLFFLNT